MTHYELDALQKATLREAMQILIYAVGRWGKNGTRLEYKLPLSPEIIAYDTMGYLIENGYDVGG